MSRGRTDVIITNHNDKPHRLPNGIILSPGETQMPGDDWMKLRQDESVKILLGMSIYRGLTVGLPPMEVHKKKPAHYYPEAVSLTVETEDY